MKLTGIGSHEINKDNITIHFVNDIVLGIFGSGDFLSPIWGFSIGLQISRDFQSGDFHIQSWLRGVTILKHDNTYLQLETYTFDIYE